MNDVTVLLTTRDPSLLSAVRETVDSVSHLRLETIPKIEEACASLRREEIALMVCHLAEPKDSSKIVQLMRNMVVSRRPVATLVISENYDAEQTLSLLRAGAADCLGRPLDLRRLAYLFDTLTLRARHTPPAAVAVSQRGRSPDEDAGLNDSFIYAPSGALCQLIEQVRRVAPQDMTVLLGGETGTGKTRLARLIHDLSPRKKEPFLTVNCGSLSGPLMDSELFGHVKGAFTGADRDRVGKFAEVRRGTLLLDDIDVLTPELQAKLLRGVEERVFEAIGSNRTLPMEARLIVASNRVLKDEVAAGRFRADLYYRLNVLAIYLPPLREQTVLLPALVARFISEYAAHHGRPVDGIAPEALCALQDYSWPGNIRELRNVIERAIVLSAGTCLDMDSLPDTVLAAVADRVCVRADAPTALPRVQPGRTLFETKEASEAIRIVDALARNNNNRLKAAAELGISRMTLYNKMHRYGLIGVTS